MKNELDSTLTLCRVFVLRLDSIEHVVQHEGAGLYIADIDQAAIHNKTTEVSRVSVQACIGHLRT
jgi:hypothetical protein